MKMSLKPSAINFYLTFLMDLKGLTDKTFGEKKLRPATPELPMETLEQFKSRIEGLLAIHRPLENDGVTTRRA